MSTSYDIIRLMYYSCLSRCFCFCFISNRRKKQRTLRQAHTPLNNFHFSSPNTCVPCALTHSRSISRVRYAYQFCISARTINMGKLKIKKNPNNFYIYITFPKSPMCAMRAQPIMRMKKAKMAPQPLPLPLPLNCVLQPMTETKTR